jgi:hypothetical protein
MSFADWSGPSPALQLFLQVYWQRLFQLEQILIKTEQQVTCNQVDNMACAAKATLPGVETESLAYRLHGCIVV